MATLDGEVEAVAVEETVSDLIESLDVSVEGPATTVPTMHHYILHRHIWGLKICILFTHRVKQHKCTYIINNLHLAQKTDAKISCMLQLGTCYLRKVPNTSNYFKPC